MVRKIKHRKGQGLSINMIVVIALAVFVIFLVMGFITGGWSYFAKLFKETAPGGGGDTAVIKCQSRCNGWINAGCPESGYYYEQVKEICHEDIDWDNDGETSDDRYGCLKSCSPHGAVVSKTECSC